MASPTPNKGYTYPAHGGAVNAWDTPLNTDFDTIDSNLGGAYNITVTSTATTATYASTVATLSSTVATATIPSTTAANLFYYVSGALTQNLTIAMPAVGAIYTFKNATTGSFTLTAKSVAGGTGAVIEADTNAVIVTNSSEAYQMGTGAKAKLYTQLGDPNASVAGRAGTASGSLTDATWDATNRQLYACVLTGVSTAAVWSPQVSRVTPQGILTTKNDTNFPVVTANTAAATTLYYTPYVGNWTVLSNGTVTYPYQFSRFTLTLVAGMAANNIYDVFMYANPTSGIITPVIGTGPTWATGGGSVTAGANARGTGAGSTALSRLGGVLTNTVQVTLTNGGNSYTCPANQGVYLGSIFIDSTNGQITCHVGSGASRRWSVWNAFNRRKLVLEVNEPVADWNYAVATWRQSRADTGNTAAPFIGLPEENVDIQFTQYITLSNNNPRASIGIGVNSTTSPSGIIGNFGDGGAVSGGNAIARYQLTPVLGFNNINSLEINQDGLGVATFNGDENMSMVVAYNG